MVKNSGVRWGRGSPGKSPARSKRRSLSSRSGPSHSAGSSSAATSAKSANINVAVRVRPENEREKSGAYNNIINVIDKNMLIFDPQSGDEDGFFFKGKKQGMRDLNKRAKKDKTFTFDNVYGQDSNNQQIFEGTTKNVVGTLMEGYNCCVFAYGATGAGKTFTMLGAKDKPGIIYLTMKEIFARIEETEDTSFELFMSYLEVYNESIRDLLQDNKSQLNIREDSKNGTTIPGLSVHKPKSPNEVLSLLSYGNNNRTQHPTDHNKESSRSHAVLQIVVQQKAKDAGLSAEVKTAKLSMIDLAGSEKGTATGHKGARFREGANINKSLLALGNCINALASGSKYIPYRDSKLTRLLKDSIGGNCATVMIANVSPSSITYEDTLNTLKYADRAKKIKIDLKKNVLNVDFHIAQYAKIVEDLRTEIVSLKEKIKVLELENEELKHGSIEDVEMGDPGGEPEDMRQISSLKAQLSALIERQKDYDDLQQRVANFEKMETDKKTETTEASKDVDAALEAMLENRRMTIEKIGNEKALLSSLELRVHFKKLQDERCDLVCLVQLEKEKSAFKTKKTVESLEKKIERKHERVKSLMADLGVLNRSIADHIANNPDSSTARSASARSTLDEHKAENSLLHEVIHSMEAELQRLHGDLCASLPLLLKNEKLLRGHGIQGKAEKEEFQELQNRIQGTQQITWADNLNNSVSTELVSSIYKQCSRLDLPSLGPAERRCSSVEQRKLFADSTMQVLDTGEDEMDGVSHVSVSHVSVNPTPCKQISFSVNKSEVPPSTSSSVIQVPPSTSSSVIQVPPSTSSVIHQSSSNATDYKQNPSLEESDDNMGVQALEAQDGGVQALEAHEGGVQALKGNSGVIVKDGKENGLLPIADRGLNDTFEAIPPTPQLTRQSSNPPTGNTTTNTSFVATPQEQETKSGSSVSQSSTFRLQNYDLANGVNVSKASKSTVSTPDLKKTEETGQRMTPKRLAEKYADETESETPEKKMRLDGQSAWLNHRPVSDILDSPAVKLDADPADNRTFVLPADGNATFTQEDSPEKSSPKGTNETVILVDRLDQQCDLGSVENEVKKPATSRNPKNNLNSTFALEDEPMDIDSTRSISDMSIIQPPAAGTVKIRASPRSPVRAGLGISPRGYVTRKSPSPLRQSTLLDLKAPQKGNQPSQLQGQGKKPVKRTLRPSMSTSALPRQGALQAQPVSFRSTIQRLGTREQGAQGSYLQKPGLRPGSEKKVKGTENVVPTGPRKPTVKRSMSSVFRKK